MDQFCLELLPILSRVLTTLHSDSNYTIFQVVLRCFSPNFDLFFIFLNATLQNTLDKLTLSILLFCIVNINKAYFY